jgi:hypothetical protein
LIHSKELATSSSPTIKSYRNCKSKLFYSSSGISSRSFSSSGATTTPAAGTTGGKEGEVKIKDILNKAFPSAKEILVQDISGTLQKHIYLD